MSDKLKPTYFRPEASPTDFKNLHTGGQEAVKRILEFLNVAACELPALTETSPNDFAGRFGNRSSRLVFLDGKRGSGKTTIMLSLYKLLSGEGNDEGDIGEQHLEILNKCRQHAVMLTPLDLEESEKDTNLLVSLLLRIEDKFPRGDSVTHRETAAALSTAKSNAALSWDDTFLVRETQNMGPDSRAIEIVRAEQARLNLREQINSLLNGPVAKLFKENRTGSRVLDPLFILAVDDCDLSPRRGLDMLKLTRILALPRLLFLVLADLKTLEFSLALKYSKVGYALAGESLVSGALTMEKSKISSVLRTLSNDAFRKMIPPHQRVDFSLPKINDALKFRPLGLGELAPLGKQLESIDFSDTLTEEKPTVFPTNILDFIGPTNILDLIDEPSTEPADLNNIQNRWLIYPDRFPHSKLLLTSSRSLIDLWFMAADQVRREKPDAVLFALAGFEAAVKSDSNLDVHSKEILLASARRTHRRVTLQ